MKDHYKKQSSELFRCVIRILWDVINYDTLCLPWKFLGRKLTLVQSMHLLLLSNCFVFTLWTLWMFNLTLSGLLPKSLEPNLCPTHHTCALCLVNFVPGSSLWLLKLFFLLKKNLNSCHLIWYIYVYIYIHIFIFFS